MTINGPAPMILAMFMNTAIDQQVEKYLKADPPLGRRAAEDRCVVRRPRRARYSRRAAAGPTTAWAWACSA
jgi:methylmalonyl-CoA mutase